MLKESKAKKNISDRELSITQVVNAPRELVFKAWTDKKMLAKWWGPNGFTSPVCEMDARPNGKIYIDMKAPDGTVYPMGGEVHEISAPEKFVFTSAALDEDNRRLFEVMNAVTLTDESGKTKLTLHIKVSKIKSPGRHHLKGMNEGWAQSIERLINLVE
ncbi:MAG: SRPBCC domain-containing protein [Bacteroidota bacterium]|nr:SRPBCC domain-containing protein [Bacteroidota bacterium]